MNSVLQIPCKTGFAMSLLGLNIILTYLHMASYPFLVDVSGKLIAIPPPYPPGLHLTPLGNPGLRTRHWEEISEAFCGMKSLQRSGIPSRELTYPTWRKGQLYSKVPC